MDEKEKEIAHICRELDAIKTGKANEPLNEDEGVTSQGDSAASDKGQDPWHAARNERTLLKARDENVNELKTQKEWMIPSPRARALLSEGAQTK